MKSFKLDDIEKNSKPFSVPEGYFDDLPMKIQSKIATEKKEIWIKTPAFRLAFSVAAVLTIVMSVIFVNRVSTAEDLLADIPEEELLAYIDLTQIDEDEILAAFQETSETIDFFGTDGLESLELEDESLDEILNEYDLSDEYL